MYYIKYQKYVFFYQKNCVSYTVTIKKLEEGIKIYFTIILI